MDVNKVIDVLSKRHAQKSAILEKEVAFLLAENDTLKKELEKFENAEGETRTE